MNLKQLAILTALAGAITPIAVSPVEAARAVVTRSTNVHSGPGSDFRVIGRVRGGDRVNVTRCASSRRWCRVQSRHTRDGWVRSRFLDRVSRRGPNRRGGICFFGAHGEVCLGR
ncbi:SH3 domain-containing protein [Pseudaminobacter sp. 19-2017]|uniref:SH3 domain-containing protein n=1 Tax=Pseudaminobacter soli (ex Zhang et al. 2022) TaxID=2831468 RepID=A0A942DYP6_9HYPH|nr:SH3 domain-containing protein [Pseudaminobacter soli]MBS3647816.1 SH3 domain-containing protein [Pseudaminobacter soli]